MNLNLNGKTAIVTGGAKGIGLKITEALLEEGVNVCMAGTDAAVLKEQEKRLSTAGNCIGIQCDVTDSNQIGMLFDAVESHFGGIDILVNNAGVLKPKKIEELSEEEWDRGMNVNLKSIFLCTKASIKPFRKRGGGVIINAASFAAQIPSVGQAVYASAKTGVKAFTRVSAAELAPDNIRVLAYIPGVINTQLIAPLIADAKNAEKMKNDIALHRFGEPEEIASVVAFMASEKAGYVSGTSIEISGGKLCVQNPSAAYK